MIACPSGAGSRPGTTDSTPAGSPASAKHRPTSRADSGVSSAGLTTMVQPAASAAPSLRKICSEGKFHGVIAAVTPAGCLSTRDPLGWHGGRDCHPVGAPAFLRQPLHETHAVLHPPAGLLH